MAPHVIGQNDVARTMVETVRVRVQRSPSSSCSPPQSSNPIKLRGSPVRFMFYRDGSWIDFPSDVQESIRLGFSERKPMMDISIGGSRYIFDFLRMLQIDFGTGNQRSIAWIDKNSNCIFPRKFVGEDMGDENGAEGSSGNTPIKIEIRIDGSSCKRKGEELESSSNGVQDEGSSLKRQRLATANSETPIWPNAKILSPGDRAYLVVSKFFLVGIRRFDDAASISAIHQCTLSGPLEKARFEVFQKQIETVKAARGASNTVYAWYGASAKDVAGVLAHGFSVSNKVSGTETNGVGIYLYPMGLPHISALQSETDDNGQKHMILCRVILGNVEEVQAGSQQCHPSSEDFDTGADDPKNPERYVVWFADMNRNILPECVVSYKSSDNLTGQVRGSAKYPFWKLFSKMENSLPEAKLQEAKNLYGAFRAGKVTRDIFVKQLRSVVGEQMLKSTIREIIASE
ncbi:probable inactive poly [ADP-ribose] polymerase SRO3 [Corylus avellana]|uniref:probable inactive poly [ADP-ribose] polymerase SRO3 n=1 Tax=Corylus avellana TaxID=13451 RepID=UPI00286C772C|nr:probable inactive poly [ADP-ribose] polymerase SRO3 [Corylus avellana]